MRRQFFGGAVLFALSYASAAPAATKPATGQAAIRLLEKYGNSEASFEQNVGQTPAGTGFLGRGLTYSLSLNGRGAVLETQTNGRVNRAVELILQNASETSAGTGVKRLPVRTSYMIGSDPSKWLKDVPTFEKVRYSEVWPGIDVVYYGTHNQLEYDFVVHPGADTDAIRLQFKGLQNLRLNGAGDLVLDTQFGELVQHRPRIYQKIGEKTTDVAGRYAIGADQSVKVEVQRYDKSSDLIVDPVLSFARVLDPHYNNANGVFADGSGNSYYVGSGNIQLAPGVVQLQGYAFKLDPSGNQAGNVTFGGTTGPTVANAVATDAAGNVYVTGSTSATDFTTSSGGFQLALAEGSANGATDAFLVKLNPSLTGLLYGTYIGGGAGSDVGNAIAVDTAGNAYVAGQTSSASFPKTVGQAFRASGTTGFAIKVNTNAAGTSSKVWATYLGGTGTDFARGISLDGAGNVTVGGSTTSSDFQPSSSTGFNLARTGQDGFLVTLNAAGSAASYFTYFPLAPINGIAGSGSVIYATGQTNGNIITTSTGFQLSGGAGHAFLAKFNTAVGGANSLLYSSYLGGAGTEIGKSVAADANGNASVVGQTSSTNFPTTAGAVPVPSGSGPPDGFLSTINTNASGPSGLVYSTLLGGTNADTANGVAIDGFGNIFVTGFTLSGNFVGSPNFAGVTAGGYAYALKFGTGGNSSSGTVSPTSGTGSSQAFTFTYTDPNGFQNIAGSQIVINSTLTGVNSCYLLFGRSNNTISLADDAGNPGPTTSVGFPGVLQNSQCSVLSSVSSQSGSGNTETLTLYVVFKPGFAGPKNVYTSFNNNAGVNTGFQPVGTFTATVNTQPIAATSVVPSSGTGTAQSFTFNYYDPNGYQDLAGTQVVFNTALNGVNACYVLFGRGTNQISLADNSGNTFTTAPLGAQTVLENSQCMVFAANSYQSGSGTNLSLTLFVAFKPAFAGSKLIFSGTNDNAGTRSVFAQLGSWTVPSSAPALSAVNVTPAAATGPSQALTFVFADPNGFQDISGGQVVVNPTLTAVNSCSIQFARGTGQINLAGDDGNSTSTGFLGQSGVLQNSQCIVNLASSYQSGSGNYLNLTLFVTMKTSGMKNVFAQVGSINGNTSTFATVGTWNVTAPTTMQPVGVAPQTGAAAAGTQQFFSFAYSDPAGANDISGGQIVLNPSLQGPGACYILFGRGNSSVSLASNDANTFTSGTLGSGTVLQNSQCSIDLSKSFQVQSGNTLNLTLAVTFSSTFRGLLYTFSNVQNNAGAGSGYVVLGNYQVQ